MSAIPRLISSAGPQLLLRKLIISLDPAYIWFLMLFQLT